MQFHNLICLTSPFIKASFHAHIFNNHTSNQYQDFYNRLPAVDFPLGAVFSGTWPASDSPGKWGSERPAKWKSDKLTGTNCFSLFIKDFPAARHPQGPEHGCGRHVPGLSAFCAVSMSSGRHHEGKRGPQESPHMGQFSSKEPRAKMAGG